MEILPKDVTLAFQPDTLEAVRKLHGLDKPGDLDNAINALDDWIKQQAHFLKKNFDRDYLERLIIASKGSVARAKERLDRISTLKTLMPQYFGDYNINVDFDNLKDRLIYVPLPKMTETYERILFVSCSGKYYDSEIFLNAYRNIAMLVEYFKLHDYADSYLFVVDMRFTNLSEIITKLGLLEARQVMSMITDGYGLRLKGMHLLTNSKIIDAFVMLLRQIMSEKLGGRIHVHKTLESLQEVVPKEVLPKDYGGDELSLVELKRMWNAALSSQEYRSHWREMAAARTDESRRPTHKFNAEYLGIPGTFRTLTVD